MNTIINPNSYPIFTPNQVLSDRDLNQLVNYLDQQNRLTRAYLIGVGIVCGLEVSSSYEPAQAQIHISPGYGITSEGYAIALSTTTLTHYQAGKLEPATLFAPTKTQDDNVIELFEKNEKQSRPLNQTADGSLRDQTAFNQFFGDRVLVVVCELQDVQRDSCRLDYNNLNQERSLVYRFFLLPKAKPADPKVLTADTLLKNGFKTGKLPSYWQGVNTETVFTARNHYLQEFDQELQQFRDFAPKVQRFGYSQSQEFGKSVDLTKISDYQTFRDNYYLICENAIASIDNAFTKLFRLFSPFFSSFQPNLVADFSNLKQRLELILEGIKPQPLEEPTVPLAKVEPTYALQYFYDYLSLLVAAYDELAEAAFELMDDCVPDTQRFPKFLLLGTVPSSEEEGLKGYEPASAYRSHFTQPPIYNGNQQRVKQVLHLCDRLKQLCQEDSFCLLPFSDAPLKITPSQDSSIPLSKQAIPYYLKYAKLYQYWSYDAYRKGRSHLLPAYFRLKEDDKNASVPPREDLIYRLDGQNFYRIEGHIGKANGDVLKRIQEYQQRYNLAFDVITLKLGSQASLQDLNISGQFDDLEADFNRIKYNFQSLWQKYTAEWSSNALLQTLKQFFFEKPALTAITNSQLFNPILELARKPENYEFLLVKANNQTGIGLQLKLSNSSSNNIARYVTQPSETQADSSNQFSNLIIDFTGLANDAIEQEKQRIANELAACFALGKVTYEVVIDSTVNPAKYVLRLTTDDVVQLPSSTSYRPVLLSLNHFSITTDNNNAPVITQPEFQDFETLYSLLRDSSQLGNSQAAEELNYYEIKGLLKVYQQRIDQLIKLHLFNQFAQQHPGIEHLGGVPKGGTFILVYVDGEEINQLLAADKDPAIYKLRSLRTTALKQTLDFPPAAPQELISSREQLIQELQKRQDVVVGDFCLPYRCSSDAPAVNYVLARPRPIILLEKTVFCEGDRTKYKFILEPEGGTVRGEGVVFEGIEQLFQPSSIDPASKEDLAQGQEVAITFSYKVDDTYDTLTVTIYPHPRPNLSISDGQTFCHNATPQEITLAEGTPENIELIQVLVNNKETKTLDPKEFATSTQPETVTITALVRNLQTQCENTITRRVIINSLPVAELSVTEGENFCHNAIAQTITLATGTPENVELIQVLVNNKETRTLNTSQFATGNQPETVTITARIRDRQTQCENTITRTVTINPLPVAELSITDGENFCHNTTQQDITLAAGTPENIELTQVLVNGKETRTLNTSQFATGNQPETVTITARIRNKQTQCENTITRTITINPLPVAELSITDGETFCHNATPQDITLAAGTPENIELIQVLVNNKETKTLDPSQFAASQPQTVTITAIIRNQQTQCENTITRTITINPLPVAELSITDGENFCHNSTPQDITLAAGTPENIELIQVFVNNKETKTLDPSQFAASQPQTVTITAIIGSKQTQCENTITRTVTINPLPVADLSITEGENFCYNATPQDITLAAGTPENIELVQVLVNSKETKTLNLSEFATGNQPETVTITARIRNKQTQCENTISRTVTINPLPVAELSITEGQTFCHNATPQDITLAEGTPENIELIQVLVNSKETKTLNLSEFATGNQPETVTITARIRNKQTQCENTITRTVTINPLPVAELSITEGENFCHNATPKDITLATGTPENIELIQVLVNNKETKTLNPKEFATGNQPETVTITAIIRSQQTQCENTITRTVTINPLPVAELSINEGENFCHNTTAQDITLAAGTPENIELIQVLVNNKETKTLDPSQFATGNQPETVTITARIRNQQTQCENTLTRTVTINPLPVADFQAEIASINAQGFSVRVFNIQPADKSSFSFVWEHPNGSPNTSNPGNTEFIINYNYDFNTWVAGAEVSITLRVITPPNQGNCSSEPVTKNIAIPFGGVVELNLLFIKDNQVRRSIALGSDRTFKILELPSDYEYTIQAVTVPATGDNVVFTYTAPGDDARVSQPINTPYLLPDGWQTIVGIHRIQAQPLRVINGKRLAGVAASAIIRINDDGTDANSPTPSAPKSATLLNRLRVLFQVNNEEITVIKVVSKDEEPATSLVSYDPTAKDEYKIKPNYMLGTLP